MNEVSIARKYILKSEQCGSRKIPFQLTFSQYKKLIKTKKCFYTGLKLIPNDPYLKGSLERLDNSKGYTAENTVVCCQAANTLKSIWEHKDHPLTIKDVLNMMIKLNEVIK